MLVTRSRASGQPAQPPTASAALTSATDEPSTSSQPKSTIDMSQASNSKNKSNKRAKVSGVDAATAQPAEPSPYMLPIELLVHIFLYLDTSQLAGAGQACRTWHAASVDVRAWRYLSFTKTQFDDVPEAQLREYFKSIGARCDNTIESVDFDNLSRPQAELLIAGLEASIPNLRHIRYSSESRIYALLAAVITLAKRCPKLETMDLRTYSRCYNSLLAAGMTPSVARPRYFRLIMPPSGYSGPDLPVGQAALFDHATTIEFKVTDYEALSFREHRWMTVGTLARLLSNPAIEKLTVHGLWSGGWVFASTHSISAPSLTHLDLRWSGKMLDRLTSLDAPKLRMLAIDSRLLQQLTPASTSTLSSLTIRIVGLPGTSSPIIELSGIEKVKTHQGSLKLTISSAYAEAVLSILSAGFLWAGLEQVEIVLTDNLVGTLTSIIAARQAGARGASKEQYLELLRKALAMIGQRRITRAFKAELQREAPNVLAAASIFQLDAEAIPLCSQVQWKIGALGTELGDLLGYLEAQPNVEIQKL